MILTVVGCAPADKPRASGTYTPLRTSSPVTTSPGCHVHDLLLSHYLPALPFDIPFSKDEDPVNSSFKGLNKSDSRQRQFPFSRKFTTASKFQQLAGPDFVGAHNNSTPDRYLCIYLTGHSNNDLFTRGHPPHRPPSTRTIKGRVWTLI